MRSSRLQRVPRRPAAPPETTRYHYNWLGELIKKTELAGGRYQRYDYNNRGLLSAVRRGHNATLTGTGSSFGDADYGTGSEYASQTTTYMYTSNGWIDTITQPASPSNIVTDYNYNSLGLVQTVTRAGTTTDYEYDANAQVTSEITTGPNGLNGTQILKKTTRQHDDSGRLVVLCEHSENASSGSPADQDRITQYVWCRDNRLLRMVRKGNDPDDGSPNSGNDGIAEAGDWYEEYEYDDAMRPVHVKWPWLNPDTNQVEEQTTDLTLDKNGNLLSATLAGRVSAGLYDFLNRQTVLGTPEGMLQTNDYPPVPWQGPTRQVWARGTIVEGQPVITSYLRQERRTYDALGRGLTLTVMAAADAPAATPPNASVDPTVTSQYFPDDPSSGLNVGRLQLVKDPLNRQFTREYDDANQRVSLIDPLSNFGQAKLDAFGRRWEDQAVEVALPTTPQSPWEFPFATQSQVRTGVRTSAYDGQDFLNQIKVTGKYGAEPSAPDLTSTFVNSGVGLAAQVTNPRSVISNAPLDALGQAVSSTEDTNGVPGVPAVQREIKALYTRGGPVGEASALGAQQGTELSQFRSDPQGRRVRTRYPDNTELQAGYSVFGEPRKWHDPRDVTITTDVAVNSGDDGRVVTQAAQGTQANQGLVGDNQTQRLTFDRLGRLVKAEMLDATDHVVSSVVRVYSDLGRLTSETQTLESWSYSVSYGYRLSGALERVTYPHGEDLVYSDFDELDRPRLVSFAGGKLAKVTYAGQRLVRIELFTTVDHAPLPPTDELTLALDVGHDEYGRTTDYLWRGALTEAIDWFATERDENGNPKYEWADLLPSTLPRPFGKHWSFLNDGVDRLKEAKSGNTIDANGNITGTPRVTMTWTLDDLGSRTGFVDNTGTHVGTFNNTNQMVTDVVGSRTATLVHDAAGNCLSSKQTNGVGYFYKYDVFNRLRQVYSLGTATVNSQGAVVSGTLGPLLATYVYDALGRRIHEVLSGVGSGSRRFLYGSASPSPFQGEGGGGGVGWQVLEERNPAAAGQPLTKRYFWGTQELDELWALDHYPEGQPPQRYLCTRDLRHNIRALVWYDPTASSGGGFNGASGAPGEGEGGGEGGAPPEGWAPDYGGYDAPPETLPVPDPEPPPEDEWPPADEGGAGGSDFPPDGPGQMDSPSGGGGASPTVILERYLYKPYGERIAFNPANSGVVSADDDPSTIEPFPTCAYGFQGLHHDVGTFLVYVRERYYHAVLNRFTQHDALGYADGMNLYEAFRSNPTVNVDPMGTDTGLASGWSNGDLVFWKHFGWYTSDEELEIGKYYYVDGQKYVVRQTWDSSRLFVLPLELVEGLKRRTALNDDFVDKLFRRYGREIDPHTGKAIRRSSLGVLSDQLREAFEDFEEQNQALLSAWDMEVFYAGNLWMVLTGENLATQTTVPLRMRVAAGAVEAAPFAIAYRQQIAAAVRIGFSRAISAADAAAERITASALAQSEGSLRLGTFPSFGPVSRSSAERLLVPRAAFVHDEYVRYVRPGAVQKEFRPSWSSSTRLGVRRYDDFDAATRTAFEGNTTPWGELTAEDLRAKVSEKLSQLGADIALQDAGVVNRVIWFGTEELPTMGAGAQLRTALDQAGIRYYVVPPPP